jgi:hypothetical protein
MSAYILGMSSMKGRTMTEQINTTATVASTERKKLETFIVPNGWMYVGDLPAYAKEDTLDSIKRTYGLELQDHDVLITLWTVDPEEEGDSNIECHGLNHDSSRRFSHYAPLSLFENKKEGDTVTFSGAYGTFEVKLCQLGYRYRRFGAFEEVLRKQVRNTPVGSTYRR